MSVKEVMNSAHPSSCQELENIAKSLSRAKRAIVVAGAGISTAAGIPDFRSSGGLYAKGEVFHERALHDAKSRAQLRRSSLLLHQMATNGKPTYTHKALVAMRNAGRLLRCYTQNVDLLEQQAGLSSGLEQKGATCIELHGSHRHLRCYLCQHLFTWDTFEARVAAGQELLCPDCEAYSDDRQKAGKRRLPIGQLLPDIVRLGQQYHPHGEAIFRQSTLDERAGPDFLLVLGTSLKVDGPKKLVKSFARAVRGNGGTVVFVGLSKPRHELRSHIDYWVDWDCDRFFRYLKKHAADAFGSYEPTQTIERPMSSPRLQDQVENDGVQAGSSFEDPIVLD